MWLLLWIGLWLIYVVAGWLVCRAAYREAQQEKEKVEQSDEIQKDFVKFDVREKPPWFWY